jgi:UDP-N-acetylglucosamine 1-carboxyvinyltransferase
MDTFLISGKNRLYGTAKVQGAKNSVLPILAASILNGGKSEISNCPELTDVTCTLRILRHLGCEVHRDGDVINVDSSGMSRNSISDRLMREMRSSIIFLGAILARTGSANISYPGGCNLGARPIDLHLWALRELGATIDEAGGTIICKAEQLAGKDITLAIPSVGATENIMLAATAAKGITRIHNAAREPEIADLQAYLRAAGTKVTGAGTSTIEIEGGNRLRDVKHRIIPDRIVTISYMAAVAAAGGEITIEGAEPDHISAVTAIMREAGCVIREEHNRIHIKSDRRLRAVKPIRTMPYPGFPTDAQSPLMAVMCRADGTSVFVENIFENRYRCASELMRMGADIRIEGRVAVVCGVPQLYGAKVAATDLRGGAALVIAALGAEGESEVSGIEHIERGYDQLDVVLKNLGAKIERKSFCVPEE